MRIEQMTVQLNDEKQLIAQRGAAALWRLPEDDSHEAAPEAPSEAAPGSDGPADDTCFMHAWTCIWCSMTPPICGSCRPVTPPCPATGLVHTCACSSDVHRREAA